MNINLLNEWLDEPFIIKNSTDVKKPYYNNIDLYYKLEKCDQVHDGDGIYI